MGKNLDLSHLYDSGSSHPRSLTPNSYDVQDAREKIYVGHSQLLTIALLEYQTGIAGKYGSKTADLGQRITNIVNEIFKDYILMLDLGNLYATTSNVIDITTELILAKLGVSSESVGEHIKDRLKDAIYDAYNWFVMDSKLNSTATSLFNETTQEITGETKWALSGEAQFDLNDVSEYLPESSSTIFKVRLGLPFRSRSSLKLNYGVPTDSDSLLEELATISDVALESVEEMT